MNDDPYKRLRGWVGQHGDFVIYVPVTIVEKAGPTGRIWREFFTPDGLCIGRVRAPTISEISQGLYFGPPSPCQE